MDKNLNNQPPIENDVVSQIENHFEQQQVMQPQMNVNMQQQYMAMNNANMVVTKKKGIGLGITTLIVSILAFGFGLIPAIGLFVEIPGAFIVFICGIIALFKNRMLGKVLAIIGMLIMLFTFVLDLFIF